MKKIALLTIFLPTIALSQMPPGFNGGNMANMEKNMQAMMAQMTKVEQCMSQIDDSKMDALGMKAEKAEWQVSQLCQQGKRDQAQNAAIKFSKEINQNPELIKMNGCMKNMSPMMNKMPFNNMFKDIEKGGEHVCGK